MHLEITKNTVIAADLDGTLAESKLPIKPDMAEALSTWLKTNRFAVISGGEHSRFDEQIIKQLPSDTNFSNLYLFPTNGATCFNFKKGEWKQLYQNMLTEDEVKKIYTAFNTAISQAGVLFETKHGEQIENRGGQISFSALGQQAPIEEKVPWDPDQVKRKKITKILIPLLPEFHVAIGGATTIDVTHKGIDKEFATRKIVELLNIQEEEIIFFGDAIYEGGNDFAVTRTKAHCVKVDGPDETRDHILYLTNSFLA